ncbi:hypothetical protein [Dokdonella sp.]|uniref:hypothetical protein n=1 Tax=Dokdonella sp. TaxID=2291710 RepID=UPI00352737C4
MRKRFRFDVERRLARIVRGEQAAQRGGLVGIGFMHSRQAQFALVHGAIDQFVEQ